MLIIFQRRVYRWRLVKQANTWLTNWPTQCNHQPQFLLSFPLKCQLHHTRAHEEKKSRVSGARQIGLPQHALQTGINSACPASYLAKHVASYVDRVEDFLVVEAGQTYVGSVALLHLPFKPLSWLRRFHVIWPIKLQTERLFTTARREKRCWLVKMRTGLVANRLL